MISNLSLGSLLGAARTAFWGQILDPDSTINTLLTQSPHLLPILPAAVEISGGLLRLFQPSAPIMIGMAAAGSGRGGKKGGKTTLSDKEFEAGYLNYLQLHPELADALDVQELTSRIEQGAVRGESISSLWNVLSLIQAETEDKQVKALAREASEKRQRVFEVGLEPLSKELKSGKATILWKGLAGAVERREYDHVVDLVVALLRRNDRNINYALLQFPHPAVRSFVYSFLVSYGHWDKVRLFWNEFETVLFPEDIETTDRECQRFTLAILMSVIAVGSDQERALAVLLHFAVESGESAQIRAVSKVIVHGEKSNADSPLSYLLFCIVDPKNPELQAITRIMLAQLVKKFEIREEEKK